MNKKLLKINLSSQPDLSVFPFLYVESNNASPLFPNQSIGKLYTWAPFSFSLIESFLSLSSANPSFYFYHLIDVLRLWFFQFFWFFAQRQRKSQNYLMRVQCQAYRACIIAINHPIEDNHSVSGLTSKGFDPLSSLKFHMWSNSRIWSSCWGRCLIIDPDKVSPFEHIRSTMLQVFPFS